MISFIICLLALIAGYMFYGKYVEKQFSPDKNRLTPANTMSDGIDYIPLSRWKVLIIQVLNISGLGPIFGAIMGAKFGTSAYLWIVFGTIFIGATHDYISGMLSVRNKGENLPEIIGRHLGKKTEGIILIFIIVIMLLVGVVFVEGPASLLDNLTQEYFGITFWIVLIFIYYIFASIAPLDKIIGRIYPIFGIVLLFMAAGILIMLFIKNPTIPEFWDGLHNSHPNAQSMPIFPMLFVSLACGAVSGFHASISPMMARCVGNEMQGRQVFFGSMVAEGIISLIWAAAANHFYYQNGILESNAAIIVDSITKEWLGGIGAIIAILGVIVAPITTGDTVLRSARLVIADRYKLSQKKAANRLLIAAPMFFASLCLLIFSLSNKDGFNMIWRYFAWSNQTLAAITLWAITVFLVKTNKNYWITLIPAIFMSSVSTTYIFIAPEGLELGKNISYLLGATISIIILTWFAIWKHKCKIVKG